MIFVDCSQDYWSKKHEISPIKVKCPTCNREFETTMPVMTRNSYGLIAPKHECEKPNRAYTFVPRCENTSIKLRSVLSSFS